MYILQTYLYTCYISWCVDCVVNTKQVKVFPNGKPWINKQIKNLLKIKRKHAMIMILF